MCLSVCVCCCCCCCCFLLLFFRGGGGGGKFSLSGLAGIRVALPGVNKAQQPQEQRYPFLSVCVVFSCVQTMLYDCQCLEFVTCAQMSMHAIAHGGCTDTVRESALKVNSGRKIPCRTRDSNPRQYCAGLAFQSDTLRDELFPPKDCN